MFSVFEWQINSVLFLRLVILKRKWKSKEIRKLAEFRYIFYIYWGEVNGKGKKPAGTPVIRKGTSMGTIIAQTYTPIELGYLEETLYERMQSKYNYHISNYLKHNWKRLLVFCFKSINRWIKQKESDSAYVWC